MSTIRACAWGERTKAAASAVCPMSSRYRPLPTISRASSRRRTGSPNSFVVTAVPPIARVPPCRRERRGAARYRPPGRGARPSSGGVPQRGGGGVHRPLDVGGAGAPAEVAADHVVDLLLGELGRRVPLLEPGG